MITSLGNVGPNTYPANGSPEATMERVVGVSALEDSEALLIVGERTVAVPPDGTMIGDDGYSVPFPKLFKLDIVPLPCDHDCSAIQGCWVTGLMLIPLGFEPTVEMRHS
jgi:hypothetical protein